MKRSAGAAWLSVALLGFAVQAEAAIVLDGKLDEPEWASAQKMAEFKVTEPNTQAQPDLKTEVRVHSDPTGLYIAYICDQPKGVERVRSRGQRDQFVPGDRVVTMIDFDGNGTTGYEFTAYLGGEKMDSIISQQINYNYDWDGEWDYAVAETDTNWIVEYRIPWTVAPLGEIAEGKRTIGLFAQRVVTATGKRFSQPGNAYARPTFVADMQKLQVAGFEKAQLDVYPYIGGSYDALNEVSKGRGGVDIFWKPSGTQQVTATINPDFGQVESDQLVVNFGAIPVYFPDKRPFFTENLSLFNTDYNILYTRRIGAAPDCPSTVAVCDTANSDIDGAVKYTGSSGGLNYGAIAAVERDSDQAEGRQFYVGRVRQKVSDDLTVGWIGTYTERPTLERRANVNALDMNWTLAPGISLRSTGVISHVEKPTSSVLSPAGTGEALKLFLNYAPGGMFENQLSVNSKSQDFNINDAGYQNRPSEHALQNVSTWYWRDYGESSSLQQSSLNSNLFMHRNDGGKQLPASWVAVYEWNRKDTRAYGLEYDYVNVGGYDDLMTRGNGAVHLPSRHQIYPYYISPRSGLFRYLIVCGVGTGFFENNGGLHYCRFEPGLYPSDSFSWTVIAGRLRTPNEPISACVLGLTCDSLIGAYDYQETNVTSDINWFPAANHSLRVKFQWIGASGDHAVAYRPDGGGTLHTTGEAVPDFHYTMTALQLRYRWEFRPQSEFFLVYSHGGYEDDAGMGIGERSLASSLRRGLAEETDSVFLAKIRYRFALL